MSFTVDSATTPHTSGNYWIDSLLNTPETSTIPGITLDYLSVSRTYVTFTFDSMPVLESSLQTLGDDTKGDIEFFNDRQKANTLIAINYISELTGIEFREVSESDADLHFFIADADFEGASGDDVAWASGRYPYRHVNNVITEFEGDSWIIFDPDWLAGQPKSSAELDVGTDGYQYLLHELGHILRLDHPHEGTILSPALDSTENTIMSYNSTWGTSPKTEFSPYDVAALTYIYGNDGLAGEYGIGTEKRIVLSVDGATVVVGGDFHDTIIGTDGNEALYGNGGDDILDGGWGSNEYYGGEGFDTAKLVLKSSDYAVSKNPNMGNIILLTYETGDFAGSISPDVEQIEFIDGVILSTDNISYTGLFTEIPESAVNPVYRFYNTEKKAFFYTSSEAERDYVLANSSNSKPDSEEWPYVYQGATFEADFGNAPLYRFYNTETGHHFFTVSEEERDFVLSKSNSGEWPFNYEGVAFNVYTESYSFTTPVHRFYNPSLNRHFFTASESEAQDIQLIGQWNYEGIGFYGGDFYSAPNPFVIT